MALVEDASTPPVVTSTATGAQTLTTAAFTPPAGSVLVALLGGELIGATAPVITVTDSGGHQWVPQVDYYFTGARGCEVAIQTCYLSSAPGSITVSVAFDANLTGGAYLALRVVTGADPYQFNGVYAGVFVSGSTTGDASVTPTHTGGWIYGVSVDYQGADSFTVDAGTTLISTHQNATQAVTCAAWRVTAATTAGSTVTGGGSWGASTAKSVVTALEILPAGTYITTGLTGGGTTTHYQYLYDSTIGATEPARTNAALAAAEADHALMQNWFYKTASPTGMTVLVTNNAANGAHWNSFPPGAVIQLYPPTSGYGLDSRFLRMLVVAEVVEIFMLRQGAGWFNPAAGNEGSLGEPLSRFLGAHHTFITGLATAFPQLLVDYGTSVSWLNSARADYINAAPTTNLGVSASTGCGTLFLYWLWAQLGFSVREIVAAASPVNFTGVYRNLTGDTTSDPFALFNATINSLFGTSATMVIPGANPDNPYPLSPGVLFEDYQTPPVVTATGAGSLTTAAFSPPARSLVVALVGGGNGTPGATVAVSDSGAHAWTVAATVAGAGPDGGIVGIAYAYLPAGATNITVTAVFTGVTGGRTLMVKTLNGVADIQLGAAWTLNQNIPPSTAGSVPVAPTVPGSKIYGISNNPDNTAAATPVSSATVIDADFVDAGDGAHTVVWTSGVPTPAVLPTPTMGVNWATPQRAQVAALEVRPAAMAPLPAFTEKLVTAAQLNTLSADITTLAGITTGQPASAGLTSKPMVKVVQNSARGVASGSILTASWDAAVLNSDNMWVAGSPTILTVNTSGWWDITAQVIWASGAAGGYSCYLYSIAPGGSAVLEAETDDFPGATFQQRQQVRLYQNFVAGTQIQLGFGQNSGSTQNTSPSFGGVFMYAIWDAPYQVGGAAAGAAGAPAPPPGPVVGTAGGQSIGDPYFTIDGNTGYLVSNYNLNLTYVPSSDNLSGTATITATATQNLSSFSLDFELTASAVTVNGTAATFTTSTGKLIITPAAAIAVNGSMTVVVTYSGTPSTARPGGSGPLGGKQVWFTTSDGAGSVAEPFYATAWYPCNDHPSNKATWDVSISVPNDGTCAITNGELVSNNVVGSQQVWKWHMAKPVATYNTMVQIGKFDFRNTTSSNGRPFIRAYSNRLSSTEKTNAVNDIEKTPEVVAYFTTMYGPYPFDSEGGVAYDAGGVSDAEEFQTRPVYSNSFSSDDMSDVVHENSHMWFGCAVSPATWKDIWLNEGFATFSEWLWTEHKGGNTTAQSADSAYNSHSSSDSFWNIKPGDPGASNLLSDPVYQRGGMTLQALRSNVGDTVFFQILQHHVSENLYGVQSTADFIALANRISGKNLQPLFDTWLFTTSKPSTKPSAG